VSILAFESVPRVFELLEANLKRNRVDNVSAYNLPVTGDGRDLELFSHLQSNSGGSTACTENRDLAGHDRHTAAPVTLDEILERHQIASCPLLKIDIEGGEYLLSRGYSMDALRGYCDELLGPCRTLHALLHARRVTPSGLRGRYALGAQRGAAELAGVVA
jgi:FkbM family methyltransferase